MKQAMDFTDRLQSLIDVKKITQQVLADGCGLTRAQISKWLNRKVGTPRRTTIHKLADYFECDIEWLATGKGKPYPTYTPPHGNAINFESSAKKLLSNLNPRQKRLAEWIATQDDDLDYWAGIELTFAQQNAEYKIWLKEQHQEKKEATGTDN
ncbi:MAG: hypothetical protein COA36_17635 [Desulfotalea sp.]|nr:MAG: hypothetical protein COA36_17635 [Desulfotalea sp.]